MSSMHEAETDEVSCTEKELLFTRGSCIILYDKTAKKTNNVNENSWSTWFIACIFFQQMTYFLTFNFPPGDTKGSRIVYLPKLLPKCY